MSSRSTSAVGIGEGLPDRVTDPTDVTGLPHPLADENAVIEVQTIPMHGTNDHLIRVSDGLLWIEVRCHENGTLSVWDCSPAFDSQTEAVAWATAVYPTLTKR